MNDKIRKLPKQKTRVETGAIQFGDDWPGVFIRGDDCVMVYTTLKETLTGNVILDYHTTEIMTAMDVANNGKLSAARIGVKDEH